MADCVEPMDTSDGSEAYTQTEVKGSASQGKEGMQLTLSMIWSENLSIQKKKMILGKRLQTWFSRKDKTANCYVVDLPNDANVVINVAPPPGSLELQELNGRTLSGKGDKKEAEVTILSITQGSVTLSTPLTEPKQPEPKWSESKQDDLKWSESKQDDPKCSESKQDDPKCSESKQDDLKCSESKQDDPKWSESKQDDPKCSESKQDDLKCSESKQDDPKWSEPQQPNPRPCPIVSDLIYSCVNHMYQEELNQISKENGVEMTSEIHVSFKVKDKNGNPDKAHEEYTNLVQKCLTECGSTFKTVPLKHVKPHEWNNALKIIKKKDKKLFFTADAEGIHIFGPEESQHLFSNRSPPSVQTENETDSLGDPSINEEAPAPIMKMTINDNLFQGGLTLDEGSWKQMTSSYSQEVEKIKSKFNVDFIDSASDLGTVTVRAYSSIDGGNASMESHAIRALLRLHQKIATALPSISSQALPNSSSGGKISQATGGTTFDEESAKSMHNNDAPSAGSEDYCSICMDTFKNKTTLVCKHEFCKECLEQSKESMGPICPVCRKVFGLVMGNQPDGKMDYYRLPTSLPGYPDCGRIIIDYIIPSGRQTEKHPHPGQSFTGLNRSAYLPDNKEGNEVLHLLQRAFAQKLIFTVGMSRTTGYDNQVTWNDIHHKTSTHGGKTGFGYPDEDYLTRVKEELKSKGIV